MFYGRFCVKLAFFVALLFVFLKYHEFNKSHSEKYFFDGYTNKALYKDQALDENGKLYVMLLGNARGGSTFVGQLLGHNDNTFYSLEPLWTYPNALRYYVNESMCEMNNINCSFVGRDKVLEKIDFVEKVFNCDREVFADSKVPRFQYEMGGPSWKGLKYNDVQGIQKRCNKSKYVVAKVLRIVGDDIKTLLNKIPKLKVVFLVRDPRGIVNSRFHLKKHQDWHRSIVSLDTLAKGVCRKMEADFLSVSKLVKQFPTRIYIIDYETIAKDPKNSIANIFEFMGVQTSEKYLNSISRKSNTTAAKRKETYSTERLDGYLTSIQWKKDLSETDIRLIDNACENVYKLVGYKATDAEFDT